MHDLLTRLADELSTAVSMYNSSRTTMKSVSQVAADVAMSLRNIIAAPDDRRPVDGWLPIESAPMRQRVIVCHGDGCVEIAESDPGRYSQLPKTEPEWYRITSRGTGKIWPHPTHWLPLPAPPTARPEVCTCPSGDGSLRWPCPQHPPEPSDARNAARYNWLRISANISWNGYVTYECLMAAEAERAEMDRAIDEAIASDEAAGSVRSAGNVDAEKTINTLITEAEEPEQAKAEGDAEAAELWNHLLVQAERCGYTPGVGESEYDLLLRAIAAAPKPAGCEAAEYVLVSDMTEGYHSDFGKGLFATHSCVKSGVIGQQPQVGGMEVTDAMAKTAADYFYGNSPFNGPDELERGIHGLLLAALAPGGEGSKG